MLHDDDWHVRQDALKVLGLAMNHSMLSHCVIVSVLTAGQVTFVNRCSTLRQYAYGVVHSAILPGMFEKRPRKFWVSPSTTVRSRFSDSFCAHNGTGDLRQKMFDTETISLWHSMLHNDDYDVRQEALKVLGLAINHSMRYLLD